MQWGIDVSKWQGDIDWDLLKENEDLDFVYIKATEGVNFIDKNALANAEGARSVNIPYGFYHFATPKRKSNGELDARDEATDFALFLEQDNEYTLVPVLDLEKDTDLTGPELELWVNEFAETLAELLNKHEEDLILYTYVSYIRKHFSDFVHNLDRFDLWLAHYTDADEPADVVKYGFKPWLIWQYTDSASILGIEGDVDANRSSRWIY